MRKSRQRSGLTKAENFETILESYYKLLDPFDDWLKIKEPDIEMQAKNALLIFYDDYNNIPIDTTFNFGWLDQYYSFLDRLLIIRAAIKNKQYLKACRELRSFMHYELIFQSRIHSSLIYLLKTELMEGNDESDFTC